jgi:hypothetical protein
LKTKNVFSSAYENKVPNNCFSFTEQNIQEFKKEEFRKYMLELSSGKYFVDIEKRKSAEKPPEASFRKLNVD